MCQRVTPILRYYVLKFVHSAPIDERKFIHLAPLVVVLIENTCEIRELFLVSFPPVDDLLYHNIGHQFAKVQNKGSFGATFINDHYPWVLEFMTPKHNLYHSMAIAKKSFPNFHYGVHIKEVALEAFDYLPEIDRDTVGVDEEIVHF